MMFTRYAIYYTAPPGPLAEFGAAWLGWDAATGQEVAHPDLPPLPYAISDLTATPRKYGFHGTIKPPFHLAERMSAEALSDAVKALAATLKPVALEGLTVTPLGSFLALTPIGDTSELGKLAGTVVQSLDRFRALPSEAELARRRKSRLTERQEANLAQWGYPYVMEDFRFHLTLTGRQKRKDLQQIQSTLEYALSGLLPSPFIIDGLTLAGEAEDGRFHEIERVLLAG